jgi:tripartite-type tricarboxylate transporter receptor subunit TctC
MRRRDVLTAIAGSAAAWPLAAFAQDYPARPVTIVAPYAAGGGADLVARLIGRKFTERLGQSFVVENRLGAGGVIAATSVAKSAPDGYTLFLGTSTQLAIQVTLHKKLPYDPAADFAPLALIASAPFVLIVHPSLQVASLTDLIKVAKAKPGQLTFGSSGVGGPPHLYTELPNRSPRTITQPTFVTLKRVPQPQHSTLIAEPACGPSRKPRWPQPMLGQ